MRSFRGGSNIGDGFDWSRIEGSRVLQSEKMLSAAPNFVVRSSLEEMLEALQRREESEKPRDIPPALPLRAVSRSRLPSAKRRLPASSEADGVRKSLDLCSYRGKMRGHGGNSFRDEKDREMESGEWFYVAETSDEKRMEESAPNQMNCFMEKVGPIEHFRQQRLQGTHEVQKDSEGHHDHEHLHELNQIASTLQSYVRGELARKEYSALLKMRNQAKLDEVNAIVKLQSVIRGWLAQRHFSHLQKLIKSTYGKVKPGISITELKNLAPEMLPLFVEVLQKRVSGVEEALEVKEKDMASLREQMQQCEARYKESEAKMKSVEENWQKQITSLQKDLAAAEKRATAKSESTHSYRKINDGTNPRSNVVKEFEKRKVVAYEDEELAIVDVKSGQSQLIIPIEKLQKLKRVIKTWMKDNKTRLRDSKTKIHSMGHHTEADSHWRAWWGKKTKRS